MALCPHCKGELSKHDNGNLYCENCNKLFKVKAEETQAAQPETQQTAQAIEQQPESQNVNEELELLKARLAVLEAEKELAQSKQQSKAKEKSLFSQKASAVITKVGESAAWGWFKKHWLIVCPAALLLIIFITLLTCLVGIRGIYVNTLNPNEFYSFTATDYEYHGTSMFSGGDYVDKGTWKQSGNKLLLTYKDEDFDKITEENTILKNENNKVLLLEDELGLQKTFKRVNIVNYSAVVTKAKITFDANGGLVNGSDKKTVKVKIGNKVQAPIPSKQDCQFMGWYTEPYGYKSGTAQMHDQRTSVWENITYYANWYNPNNYEITIIGEATGTLSAKEGDNLLQLLQAQYEDCVFTFNNKTIDSKFTMPAQNIEVNCSFSEAYWQKLEQIFKFEDYRGGTEH